MKVYYSGTPANHHYILGTFRNADLSNAILLRFDLHADDMWDAEINCSNYVSFVKERFYKVVWVNKPDKKHNFMIWHYKGMGQRYCNSIGELKDDLASRLEDRDVIIDVDPDVLKGYPWGNKEIESTYTWDIESGIMEKSELADIISSVKERILYFFFSSEKELAEEIVSSLGFSNYELINYDNIYKCTNLGE